MAGLVNISLDLSKIDKTKIKDGKYLNAIIAIGDDTNQYGQNASAYISQTKEEREAKDNRVYFGNGKVVWNDGKIVNAERVDQVTNAEQNPVREKAANDIDDLLF
jgi:hypothetical protein